MIQKTFPIIVLILLNYFDLIFIIFMLTLTIWHFYLIVISFLLRFHESILSLRTRRHVLIHIYFLF